MRVIHAAPYCHVVATTNPSATKILHFAHHDMTFAFECCKCALIKLKTFSDELVFIYLQIGNFGIGFAALPNHLFLILLSEKILGVRTNCWLHFSANLCLKFHIFKLHLGLQKRLIFPSCSCFTIKTIRR